MVYFKREKFVERSYNITYDPNYQLPIDFSLTFFYPTGSIRKDVTEIAAYPFNKPFIDFDIVDQWFTKDFFELTGQELKQFAMQLNILRVTKPRGKTEDKDKSPTDKIIPLLRKLHDLLPEAIEYANERSTNLNNKKHSEIFNLFSKHCQDMQTKINAIKQDAFMTETPIKKVQHKNTFWHLDAVFIAQQIYRMGEARGIKLSFKQVDSKLIQITQQALEKADIIITERPAIVKALNRFVSKDEYEKQTKYAPDN